MLGGVHRRVRTFQQGFEFAAAFRDAHGAVPVYFEAAAVITVLVLLGQVLELKAREQTSGAITVLGQYDARVVDPHSCAIRLVEFQSLVGQATYLGTFDIDTQKRWQFLSPSVKSERPFEKP